LAVEALSSPYIVTGVYQIFDKNSWFKPSYCYRNDQTTKNCSCDSSSTASQIIQAMRAPDDDMKGLINPWYDRWGTNIAVCLFKAGVKHNMASSAHSFLSTPLHLRSPSFSMDVVKLLNGMYQIISETAERTAYYCASPNPATGNCSCAFPSAPLSLLYFYN
jgi:hypothetical protein